ncbi:anti-sigma factor [Roseomonas sp. E05]|uniref:anti-sigma factor family protein n=1 Tax=Roseomonas sp. E05 TaxID=3046310 RepID=UPI0024BBA7D1|nr:anti-sigma factor [Roseomonas sp. E05]MDJ0390946.1 anti-sigma factor [Roseomonas sp. E05]
MSGSFEERGPIGEDDLQAWVDDRLTPERRTRVDAWLAENPEAARRFRAMAEGRAALRAALVPRYEEPIPARLRVANILADQRRARSQRWRGIAAACGWLVLGSAAGWGGRSLLPPAGSAGTAVVVSRFAAEPVVAEAVAAHRVFVADARRPVELAAAQEALLVRWLSNRLDRPIVAPDLLPLGYHLIGGRLLSGGDGDPAAQLMYEDGSRARLTIYVRASQEDSGTTAFRYTEDRDRGLSAFWWIDHGFGYVVSAESSDRVVLQQVAERVHRQLLEPESRAP